MRFLLGPIGTDGRDSQRTLDELVELAVLAEGWGFDGLLVAEGRLPESDGWASPYTILMRVARRTTALRLGGLVAPEITNPIYLAEEAAVLDATSVGRATMVVRRASREELARLASDPEPEGRYEEALEILLRSWAPPPFTFDGHHWQLPGRHGSNVFAEGVDRISVTPKPLQLVLPTWLLVERGRLDDETLARRFDLPCAWSPGTLAARDAAASLESFARPSIALRDLHLTADPKRAADEAAPVLALRYGDGVKDADAIVGDVDRAIDQLRALSECGVGMVACRPLWPELGVESAREMIRFFGEAVIPEFRMDAFPEEIRIREPQGGGA